MSLETEHGVPTVAVHTDAFMAQLAGWLEDHEPKVRIEIVRWRDQHKPDPELCTRIRAEGDAAILGVGL